MFPLHSWKHSAPTSLIAAGDSGRQAYEHLPNGDVHQRRGRCWESPEDSAHSTQPARFFHHLDERSFTPTSSDGGRGRPRDVSGGAPAFAPRSSRRGNSEHLCLFDPIRSLGEPGASRRRGVSDSSPLPVRRVVTVGSNFLLSPERVPGN